jgi:thioredoxin 1
MRDVTAETFDREVLAAETPVVVDFWAPWCGPCEGVTALLEQLEAESGGRVAFVKLDVDAEPDVSTRYGVLSLPTVILFAEGEPRATVAGARGRKHVERAFAAWLAPSS